MIYVLLFFFDLKRYKLRKLNEEEIFIFAYALMLKVNKIVLRLIVIFKFSFVDKLLHLLYTSFLYFNPSASYRKVFGLKHFTICDFLVCMLHITEKLECWKNGFPRIFLILSWFCFLKSKESCTSASTFTFIKGSLWSDY